MKSPARMVAYETDMLIQLSISISNVQYQQGVKICIQTQWTGQDSVTKTNSLYYESGLNVIRVKEL